MSSAALAMLSPEAKSSGRKAQTKTLRVNEPGDAYEHEADRVADTVVGGGNVAGWSLSSTGAGRIQRDPTTASMMPSQPPIRMIGDPQNPAAPNNYGDALGKLLEGIKDTPAGKLVLRYIEDQPIVKDGIETPAGLTVVGGAAVATIVALGVQGKPLPKQLPTLPLDFIHPGLKVKIDYEGPVNHPTQGSVMFIFGAAPSKKQKDDPTARKQQYRAETARMARELQLGAGVDPSRQGPSPGPEGSQRETERNALDTYQAGKLRSITDPDRYSTSKYLPPSQHLSLHMRDDFGAAPAAADPAKSTAVEDAKKEETHVQRKADAATEFMPDISGEVDAVLGSAGRPLDRSTRRTMEARIGFDFSKVRIHTDARAGTTAKALGARAYAVGDNIVFAPGRFAPHTREGQRLIAHELTHVVQQSPQRAVAAPAMRPAPVQIQRDAEDDAKNFSVREFLSSPRESLKKLARKIPGYDLFTVVIGKDPISGQQVERNATNLVGGFLKLVGKEETFKNLQESKALDTAFNWLKDKIDDLHFSVEYFEGLVKTAMASISLGDVTDIRAALSRIYDIFKPPLERAKSFALEILNKVFEFIVEGVLNAVGGTGVLELLKKAGSAFSAVVKDPLRFFNHLVDALKKGFNQFKDKILDYLKDAVVDWLFGEIASTGIKVPRTFSLGSIVNVVLQVLGLTYTNFRTRLVKALGGNEEIVTYIEGTVDVLAAIVKSHSLAAAWQLILEKADNLVETVLSAVKDWVITKIVTVAVAQLVALFNPAGAVIKAIQLMYETLRVFIEKAKQIAALINAIADSVSSIASGNIAKAANYIESTMAKTLPIILNFLAGAIGLGGVGQKIREVIEAIRSKVNVAIDKVLNYIVEKGKALWEKGKSAVSDALGWWQQRKEVTEGDEKHTISLEGGEDEPHLMIASTPKLKWSQFLTGKLKTVNKVQEAVLKALIPDVEKLEKRLPPSKDDTEKAKNIKDKQDLFASVTAQLVAVGLHHDTKDPVSVIEYKPVDTTSEGATGMTASVLTPGHPAGTPPQDKPKIWTNLGSLIGKKFYKRGHLLNENLGGVGRRENLTPITTRANKIHNTEIEEDVKSLVNTQGRTVFYEVTPEFKGQIKTKQQIDLETAAKSRVLTAGKGGEQEQLAELVAEQTLCSGLLYNAYTLELVGTQWQEQKVDPNNPLKKFKKADKVPNPIEEKP